MNVVDFIKSPKALAGAGGLIVLIAILPLVLRGAGMDVSPTLSLWILGALVLAVALWLVGIRLHALVSARLSTRRLEKELGAQAMPGAPPASAAEMRQKFRDSVRTLRGTLGRGFLYELPWFVLIGEPGSGKSTSIKKAVRLPLGGEQQGVGGTVDCDWFFANDAVLLDTAGRFSVHDEGSPASIEWDRFLGLLKRARPARAIDGVVVAIPADQLIGRGETRQRLLTEAERKAQLLSAKLQELQRKLGIVFPVYVLVTKCDKIQGFQEFFTSAPPALQQSLFGWSNPHPIDSNFDAAWVDEIFASAKSDLDRLRVDLLARGESAQTSDLMFLFPEELAALQPILGRYLSKIFEHNRYVESHRLRGVFFSSGGQDATPGSSLIDYGSQAPRQAPDAHADGTMVLQAGGFQKDLWGRPYFVQDFYNQKVFKESGLARPSERSTRIGSTVRKYSRIAAVVVLAGGIGFLSLYLLRLPSALFELNRDLRSVRKHLDAQSSQPLVHEGEIRNERGEYLHPVLRAYETAETHDGALRGILLPSLVGDIHETLDRTLRRSFSADLASGETPSSVAAIAGAKSLKQLDEAIRGVLARRDALHRFRDEGAQVSEIARWVVEEFPASKARPALEALRDFDPEWKRGSSPDDDFVLRLGPEVRFGDDATIGRLIETTFRSLVTAATDPGKDWTRYADGADGGFPSLLAAARAEKDRASRFGRAAVTTTPTPPAAPSVGDALGYASSLVELDAAVARVQTRFLQALAAADQPPPDAADESVRSPCGKPLDLFCLLLDTPYRALKLRETLERLTESYQKAPAEWKEPSLERGWTFDSIDQILDQAFTDLRGRARADLAAAGVQEVNSKLEWNQEAVKLVPGARELIAAQTRLRLEDLPKRADDAYPARASFPAAEKQIFRDLLGARITPEGVDLKTAFQDAKTLISERLELFARLRNACVAFEKTLADETGERAAFVEALDRAPPALSEPHASIRRALRQAHLALLTAHSTWELLCALPPGSDRTAEANDANLLPALRLLVSPVSPAAGSAREKRDQLVAEIARDTGFTYLGETLATLRAIGRKFAYAALEAARLDDNGRPVHPTAAFFFTESNGYTADRARGFWKTDSQQSLFRVLYGKLDESPQNLVSIWNGRLSTLSKDKALLESFEFLRDFDSAEQLAESSAYELFRGLYESYAEGNRPTSLDPIRELLESLHQIAPADNRDRTRGQVLASLAANIEKYETPSSFPGFLGRQYVALANRLRGELELFLAFELISLSDELVKQYRALESSYPFSENESEDAVPASAIQLASGEAYAIVASGDPVGSSTRSFVDLVALVKRQVDLSSDPYHASLLAFSASLRDIADFFALIETESGAVSIPTRVRFRARPGGREPELFSALRAFQLTLPGRSAPKSAALCPSSTGSAEATSWSLFDAGDKNVVRFSLAARRNESTSREGKRLSELTIPRDQSPGGDRVSVTGKSPVITQCKLPVDEWTGRELTFEARGPWYFLRFLDAFSQNTGTDPEFPAGHTLRVPVVGKLEGGGNIDTETFFVVSFGKGIDSKSWRRAPDFRAPPLRAVLRVTPRDWNLERLDEAERRLAARRAPDGSSR